VIYFVSTSLSVNICPLLAATLRIVLVEKELMQGEVRISSERGNCYVSQRCSRHLMVNVDEIEI